MEKRDYLPEMFNETDLEVMKAIRQAIDPLEISKPGQNVPRWTGAGPKFSRAASLERAGRISRE